MLVNREHDAWTMSTQLLLSDDRTNVWVRSIARALGHAAQAADDDRESHELSRELGLVDLP